MTLLQSILLGILQGVTEFLPISSSGHLVLIPNLLGWNIPIDQAFAFDVMLQAATLVAVLSFFLPDLIRHLHALYFGMKTKSWSDPDARLGLHLIVATIPAGLVGLFLNGFFEKIFGSYWATSIFLLVTALLLVIAERVGNRNRSVQDITWKDAFWIGIFQVLALFPGISRSGITITTGMFRDLDRTSSARFSFMISVPLLMGAGVNGLFKFIELPNTTASLPIFAAGSIVAAVVGYLSIKWLLDYLSKRSLYSFAIYCVIFSMINMILILVRSS